MQKVIQLLVILVLMSACESVTAPSAVGPIPTKQQLEWQEMEFYGFLHFNMNTFTNLEWGYGDKDPSLFNPTALDARQWARVAKEAGMKGLIITAKHHDGYCLWPSAYTEHSVKNSPWRDGKGDVIQELAEACREFDLKLGIYLSPWDRNHADYGKPEYLTYFRNQLRELLTNYGDVFEVWFDGANGGDGYYGGANETRRVDKKSYYDWENTRKIIQELQPNAVGFSDAGPEVRWVGNEHGFAYETTWSPLLKDSVYGGMPNYNTKYSMGQENGTHWVPAEADVSIRPGWYYHKSEDDKVKSLQNLLDIYYRSVGQNSTLLLNFPVDTRGLIHENDERQLKKLTAQLALDFKNNLAFESDVAATNVRGNHNKFGAEMLVDSNKETYWATDDEVLEASVTIDFKKEISFNRFLVQEYIALGQRVKEFTLEAEVNGQWELIANHTTIGYKRILRFEKRTATKIRFTIKDAKGCPLISNIEVFDAPVIVDAPEISRAKNGMVTLKTPEAGVDIFYTNDGSEPTINTSKYSTEFLVHEKATIKAFSLDPVSKRKSETSTVNFDISKSNWSVVNKKELRNDKQMIDDNIWTNGSTLKGNGSVIVDLGASHLIKGFTYTPIQSRWVSKVITHYEFFGSDNGKTWNVLSEGEFSNIMANPIQQKIEFSKSSKVRFIKLRAKNISNNEDSAIIAELGIISN